ncbi:hypothetical protein [Acinetobacter ursingii]|uniref:hypothetical protein n=1 Tax=Acinetobacter ursingii TaxID=108980 RepID=UPI003709E119
MNTVKLACVLGSISIMALSACSKKPESVEPIKNTAVATEYSPQDQLKLDTIKKMYAELSENEHGNEVLYRYATDNFKSILNMTSQFPGEMCGLDHDVVLQGQDEDYKQQVTFKLNEQKQVIATLASGSSVSYVLECDTQQCRISDVLESGDSLSQGIERDCSELAAYHESQEAAVQQTQYRMSYRIESKDVHIGTEYATFYYVVVASESDDPVDIRTINVNRGNCPVSSVRGQNHVLNFGQTYRFEIRCNPRDVKEVNLTMADGQELTMVPNG